MSITNKQSEDIIKNCGSFLKELGQSEMEASISLLYIAILIPLINEEMPLNDIRSVHVLRTLANMVELIIQENDRKE